MAPGKKIFYSLGTFFDMFYIHKNSNVGKQRIVKGNLIQCTGISMFFVGAGLKLPLHVFAFALHNSKRFRLFSFHLDEHKVHPLQRCYKKSPKA
jgi:hypothetical protein